jgi:hypothetical protein
LASSTIGSRPAAARASAAGMTRPPTSTSPRPMTGSARWASGARSPEAPTEPCDGTTGWMPSRSRSHSLSASSGRQPEWPRATVLARSRSIARTTSRGSGSPTPTEWERSRFSCNWAESAGETKVVARSPKPGGHAVDDLPRGDQPLDHVARLDHAGPRVVAEPDRQRRPGPRPRRRRSRGPRRSARSPHPRPAAGAGSATRADGGGCAPRGRWVGDLGVSLTALRIAGAARDRVRRVTGGASRRAHRSVHAGGRRA